MTKALALSALVLIVLVALVSRHREPAGVGPATALPLASLAAPQPRNHPWANVDGARSQPSSPDAVREKMAALLAAVQTEIDQAGGGHLGENQMRDLQNFVVELDAADVPDAAKALQEMLTANPTAAGWDLQMRLLNRWTDNDAAGALAWAAQTLTGDFRQEQLNTMAGIWARQNVPAAVAWAQQLPPGDEQQNILAAVTSQAVFTDPLAALNLAVALPENAGRNSLVSQAAGQWAALAPKDAAAWAAQITDPALRAEATSSVAIEMANNDPGSAATLAADSLPPGQLQNKTVIAVVQRWTTADPAAAQQWINQFPEGDVRQSAERAMNEVLQRSATAGAR